MRLFFFRLWQVFIACVYLFIIGYLLSFVLPLDDGMHLGGESVESLRSAERINN